MTEHFALLPCVDVADLDPQGAAPRKHSFVAVTSELSHQVTATTLVQYCFKKNIMCMTYGFFFFAIHDELSMSSRKNHSAQWSNRLLINQLGSKFAQIQIHANSSKNPRARLSISGILYASNNEKSTSPYGKR